MSPELYAKACIKYVEAAEVRRNDWLEEGEYEWLCRLWFETYALPCLKELRTHFPDSASGSAAPSQAPELPDSDD